mmetsp:Transcript_28159/g.60699  ORF Transcript_28159/g.60699 Transcript_28159/m.60699 type:complete len:285 (-) Transcript_28159:1102-1956(-)
MVYLAAEHTIALQPLLSHHPCGQGRQQRCDEGLGGELVHPEQHVRGVVQVISDHVSQLRPFLEQMVCVRDRHWIGCEYGCGYGCGYGCRYGWGYGCWYGCCLQWVVCVGDRHGAGCGCGFGCRCGCRYECGCRYGCWCGCWCGCVCAWATWAGVWVGFVGAEGARAGGELLQRGGAIRLDGRASRSRRPDLHHRLELFLLPAGVGGHTAQGDIVRQDEKPLGPQARAGQWCCYVFTLPLGNAEDAQVVREDLRLSCALAYVGAVQPVAHAELRAHRHNQHPGTP